MEGVKGEEKGGGKDRNLEQRNLLIPLAIKYRA
jgi:hypothetical protein